MNVRKSAVKAAVQCLLAAPGRFMHDQGMVRAHPNGLLEFRMGGRETVYEGWLMPVRGQLFCIATDDTTGALVYARVSSVPPGKVLLGGFDLVPEVLNEMKVGYVQVQVDQQPYMQGFMPVMEAYLSQKVGLSPADIDTGQGIVTPDQVDTIMELSKQGVR
jgi:hypothetical protein